MAKKFLIRGGKDISGIVSVSGSKNVVLKALVAACLTSEEIVLTNVPLINDFFAMVDLIRHIGGEVELDGHTARINVKNITEDTIPLEVGAKIRTSSLFFAPLLTRLGIANIPNPGGCRIGARRIDMHIEGLIKLGVDVDYESDDGYYHAKTSELTGSTFRFNKNTHTGTESMILCAVLAKGTTILENAALEPEIDELITLLNQMGAMIRREEERKIVIEGVESLHGTTYEVMPDRNEVVTFAIASSLLGGNITITNAQLPVIDAFCESFRKAGGAWEENEMGVRFYIPEKILPVDVITAPYPGFMTDWQAPWSILMTQADGESTIHEAVYEDRFQYAHELLKMGAKIELFNPEVENPSEFYNFNYEDVDESTRHAAKIKGKTTLHNAVLMVSDLRAGATLVLAALLARGESVVYGIEHLQRGYEDFAQRLESLGANIKEVDEEFQHG